MLQVVGCLLYRKTLPLCIQCDYVSAFGLTLSNMLARSQYTLIGDAANAEIQQNKRAETQAAQAGRTHGADASSFSEIDTGVDTAVAVVANSQASPGQGYGESAISSPAID